MTSQVGSSSTRATAGESEGIAGSFLLSEPDFPSLNSSPVQRSTSYRLDLGSQGPTGTRRVKGAVPGSAEDLLPVSEVEAGVDLQPTGWVRRQVVGHFPGGQPGTGTGWSGGGAVTPFICPEVPDSLFCVT